MQPSSYNSYKTTLQKIADIKYASAVLQWDQETYLPSKGNDARGRQIATLNELAHEHFTDEKLGALLNELVLSNDISSNQKRNVELSLEDYNKNKKLPSAFVRQMSEAINKSFHAWIQARKENNFALFEKPLQTIIDLKRQEAEFIGYEHHPYDALMNEYDKGLTTKKADKVFADLMPPLKLLLDKIATKPKIDTSFLRQHFDKNTQWEVGTEMLKRMQFDFDAGRQDISEHPFTTNFCSQDVRVTTRIDENDFSNMLWSCIHEGGHALYEQGLPADQYGLPLGEYCSLSIHESQSRLWENCIGRSRPFWENNYELLKEKFPVQFNVVTLNSFYRAINSVQPSLIRTEADELTYHFHVMIRYEIEKLLIEGTIVAKDIPTYWNQKYSQYLGVKPTDDVSGCLQDVHWSHGSFGYFATYSLGSLYAAQFNTTFKSQKSSVVGMGNGEEIEQVLAWLQKNIYAFGRYYNAEELCKKATGSNLEADYFLNYANEKYGDLYDL